MTTEQVHSVTDKAVQRQIELAATWRESLNTPPRPKILESIDAFRRDLPELLQTHRGRWVAYSGGERIGFAQNRTRLCQECFRRGLTRHDFVAVLIEPGAFDPDEEFEATEGV